LFSSKEDGDIYEKLKFEESDEMILKL